ncbi:MULTISPECIES: hypothetical protein [Corynebacterium]|uniref:hypothetical protein n=1 Tax=Corynebacterium TaxID=1716 RepID=UPI00065F82F6|nr:MULTISPECIES: hypothetical protein [Corynebacterium]MBC6821768.1 hypothetical protein [Corynebacterium sp. LK33]MBC6829322.1 hypothetical protein [Corynebacterium sp. LK32]KAA0881533.1 hypothetical protein E7L51_06855 [Corynebacterium amycolatum]MBS5167546.1 hypothetical protein [Corynebacterium sp.]OFJ56969.1 hypothetical protein HMPREF2857_03620 [Corynebacterium sp. HMSC076C10]
MKSVFRAILFTAIIFEGVLFLLMNVVSGLPGWVFLLPLVVMVAAFLLLFGGMWQDYLRNGRSWAASLSETAKKFGVPRKILALLVSEVGSLIAAFAFFRPQKNVDSEVRAFTVHRNLRTVVFMILALSVVEISIVHFAISNALWRYLLLVISVYAVVLLSGFYVTVRDHPHLITPQGLVLRNGRRLICEIPWSQLRHASSVTAGEGGDIAIDEDGNLRVPVLSEVNVRLEVDSQVVAEDLYKGLMTVFSIEIYCDDKDAFLRNLAEERNAH